MGRQLAQETGSDETQEIAILIASLIEKIGRGGIIEMSSEQSKLSRQLAASLRGKEKDRPRSR